ERRLRRGDDALRVAAFGGSNHFTAGLPYKVDPVIRTAAHATGKSEAVSLGIGLHDLPRVSIEFIPGSRRLGGVKFGLRKIIFAVIKRERDLIERDGVELAIESSQDFFVGWGDVLKPAWMLGDEMIERAAE